MRPFMSVRPRSTSWSWPVKPTRVIAGLSGRLLPRGAARYGRSCSAASGLRATVALLAGRGAKARRARPRAERLRIAPLLARRPWVLAAVSCCASTTERGLYTEGVRSLAPRWARCRFESCERAHSSCQRCVPQRDTAGTLTHEVYVARSQVNVTSSLLCWPRRFNESTPTDSSLRSGLGFWKKITYRLSGFTRNCRESRHD